METGNIRALLLRIRKTDLSMANYEIMQQSAFGISLHTIIAELGVDMSVFENVSQLASWAGVCPGNNESAGKRKSSRIPKGNVY